MRLGTKVVVSNRARLIVICVLLCAICAWQFLPNSTTKKLGVPTIFESSAVSSSTLNAASGESITVFRQEREALRTAQSKELSALESGGATTEVMEQAQLMLLNDINNQRMETLIEGLLRAKGFDEVVATVDAGAVNIIVRTDAIAEAQAAAIMEVVMRETGRSASEIKIIPVK